MSSPAGAGRRRATDRQYSAEEQALDQISKEAEERIQARRQARTEARDIRMKEIERQQKEEEERLKAQQQGIPESSKGVKLKQGGSNYSGSRRGSDDSTDTDVSSKDSRDPKDHVRELKNQMRGLEEKYKQAMVTNAQLDNIKTTHVFELEILKEKLEEQEEAMIEVQRQYKDKCKDYESQKRDFNNLQSDCESLKAQMSLKDRLLEESGLVVIANEEGEFSLSKCSDKSDIALSTTGASLISEESADLLRRAGEGTLDDKLKKIIEEQNQLEEEIKALHKSLEDARSRSDSSSPRVSQVNGPELQLYEIQREASKQIHEYKLKLQKSEQEITNLDGTVTRLETQVKRFKYDADEAEKLEDELKTDRRRLQRELRECQNQIEELQNQNKHLTKRLEKIRQSRSQMVNQ